MGRLEITEQLYNSEYNQNVINIITLSNDFFNFMLNIKVLKVDITVNLLLTIVSSFEDIQGENIALIMSCLLNVTPSEKFKSFKSQFHFSTFYIMDRKRKRNQSPRKK